MPYQYRIWVLNKLFYLNTNGVPVFVKVPLQEDGLCKFPCPTQCWHILNCLFCISLTVLEKSKSSEIIAFQELHYITKPVKLQFCKDFFLLCIQTEFAFQPAFFPRKYIFISIIKSITDIMESFNEPTILHPPTTASNIKPSPLLR